VPRCPQAGAEAGLCQHSPSAVHHCFTTSLPGCPTSGLSAGAQAGSAEKLPEHSPRGVPRGAKGGVPARVYPEVHHRDEELLQPAVPPLILVQGLRVTVPHHVVADGSLLSLCSFDYLLSALYVLKCKLCFFLIKLYSIQLSNRLSIFLSDTLSRLIVSEESEINLIIISLLFLLLHSFKCI